MGWSITLHADRLIKESDVVIILSSLSGKDMARFPSRQAWGWSSSETGLKTDIHLPSGRSIRVSGAWFSSQFAQDTANLLAARLRENGYVVRVGALTG